MTNATQPIKPVLFVLTSHGTKGETGEPTGFYLGEVTHPLAVLDAAGIAVEFASIDGGKPPVDGLDLNDPTNARYWNSEGFRGAIRNTSRLADLDPKNYAAIFSPADTAQCGTFRQARRSTTSPAAFTRRVALSLRFATALPPW